MTRHAHMTKHSLRIFTDFAGSLIADMSTISLGGRRAGFERIYDDACDIGLAVRSHHTGAVVLFAVHSERRNREGEIIGWDLVPVNQAATTRTMIIFND
jgi:hypothetical protein